MKLDVAKEVASLLSVRRPYNLVCRGPSSDKLIRAEMRRSVSNYRLNATLLDYSKLLDVLLPGMDVCSVNEASREYLAETARRRSLITAEFR